MSSEPLSRVDAATEAEAHKLNLEGARLAFAGAVRNATGSTRFRADHSSIDRFIYAFIAALTDQRDERITKMQATIDRLAGIEGQQRERITQLEQEVERLTQMSEGERLEIRTWKAPSRV